MMNSKLEMVKRLNAFRYELIGVYTSIQDAYMSIPRGAAINDHSNYCSDLAVLKYNDEYFIYPYSEGDSFDWFEFFNEVYNIETYLELRQLAPETPDGCVSFECFDEDIERLYNSFEGGLKAFSDMEWLADDLDTLFEIVAEPITIEIMFDLPYTFDIFKFMLTAPYRIKMYSEGDEL